MNKFLAASIGAAALALAAPVSAADMPAKAYTKAPAMVAAPTNWTGFYVGIAGGGGWATNTILRSDGPFTPTLKGSGGIIGGTLGYNWQTGQFVLGLEGDASWANIKTSDSNATVFPTCTAGGIGSCGTTLDFLGTARARAGYLIVPSVLVYGTGGLAVGSLKETITVGANPSETATQVKTGWTAGGGFEAMLAPNWTGKIEYQHIDLGDGPTLASTIFAGFSWTSQSFKADIVRLGFNYKFAR